MATVCPAASKRMPSRTILPQIWFKGQTVLLPLFAVLIVVCCWEAAVHLFGIPVYLCPPPSVIWEQYFVNGPPLWVHIFATTQTIILGFALAVAVSVPLAILIASSPLVAAAVYPILVLTQAVPKIAVAPLLVVILGAGESPRLAVTFLVAFFPLVASFATGLLNTPRELLELGRAYNATWWQTLYRIKIPASIPFLFSGLKISATFAVVGAVVGEFVAAERGLGYQIMSATAFFNTPVAFGAVIVLAAIGIIVFQMVELVERVFFSWVATQKAGD